MTKKQLSDKLSGTLLRVLGIAQLIGFLAFLASFFVWIWGDWGIASKVALTGIVLALICKFLHALTKSLVGEVIDQILVENPELKEMMASGKKTFQERINDKVTGKQA